jgi:hypothetical protein
LSRRGNQTIPELRELRVTQRRVDENVRPRALYADGTPDPRSAPPAASSQGSQLRRLRERRRDTARISTASPAQQATSNVVGRCRSSAASARDCESSCDASKTLESGTILSARASSDLRALLHEWRSSVATLPNLSRRANARQLVLLPSTVSGCRDHGRRTDSHLSTGRRVQRAGRSSAQPGVRGDRHVEALGLLRLQLRPAAVRRKP